MKKVKTIQLSSHFKVLLIYPLLRGKLGVLLWLQSCEFECGDMMKTVVDQWEINSNLSHPSNYSLHALILYI